MATARDVIAAINQNGSVHLGDGLTLSAETRAQTYVQFKRRTVDDVRVCYEVRRLGENTLIVQLMTQTEVGRVVDRLRDIARRAGLGCGVAAGMFGVHGGETIDCHGAGVDYLLGRVQTQLQLLYDTFEGELQ